MGIETREAPTETPTTATEAGPSETATEAGPSETATETTNSGTESMEDITSDIDNETRESLNLIKKINKIIQGIPSDQLNSYKGLIMDYRKIKDDIKEKMEEDPVFKKIMEEYGLNLDKNKDGENKETPEVGEKEIQQVKDIATVLKSSNLLNESQLRTLKEEVQKIKTQLGEVYDKLINPIE